MRPIQLQRIEEQQISHCHKILLVQSNVDGLANKDGLQRL